MLFVQPVQLVNYVKLVSLVQSVLPVSIADFYKTEIIIISPASENKNNSLHFIR